MMWLRMRWRRWRGLPHVVYVPRRLGPKVWTHYQGPCWKAVNPLPRPISIEFGPCQAMRLSAGETVVFTSDVNRAILNYRELP